MVEKAKEELGVIEVGAWEAGTHEQSGKVIVVFRFSDREPLAIGCDPAIAREIGDAMLKLGAAPTTLLN